MKCINDNLLLANYCTVYIRDTSLTFAAVVNSYSIYVCVRWLIIKSDISDQYQDICVEFLLPAIYSNSAEAVNTIY